MVLYIDSALLSGFAINFLCIDTVVSITGIKVPKRRSLAGAALLSALSLLCLFDVRIKLIYFFVYIGAIWLVFGKCRATELIRRTGICISVFLLYSAILLCLIPVERLWFLSSGGGTFFVPEDLYFYLPLGVVYIAVKTLMFVISRDKKLYSVRIQINGKSAVADAMVDTGNSLRDTDSGSPVIIAERSLFGETGAAPKIIRYKNIGSGRNYTKIYPVERLCLLEEHRVYENIYVAFVDRPLTGTGKYKVLLHNSFIERK